jgi:hypothetical protein
MGIKTSNVLTLKKQVRENCKENMNALFQYRVCHGVHLPDFLKLRK